MDRLDWCRQQQNWTIDDWRKLLFSDKTIIVLKFVHHRFRVSRGRGKPDRLQLLDPCQYLNEDVMFWSGLMMESRRKFQLYTWQCNSTHQQSFSKLSGKRGYWNFRVVCIFIRPEAYWIFELEPVEITLERHSSLLGLFRKNGWIYLTKNWTTYAGYLQPCIGTRGSNTKYWVAIFILKCALQLSLVILKYDNCV